MNKGDRVYIIDKGKVLKGTIIKRIERHHGMVYNDVLGDGYYVQVEYQIGSIRWSYPFKTSDIINWTKSVERDLKINNILNINKLCSI